MKTANNTFDKYFNFYQLVAIIMVVVLGVLHIVWADFKLGGVYWFNLDKERNLPTWISGLAFALLGFSGFISFFAEKIINVRQGKVFRYSGAWLSIGFVGLWMSLDEITILHENLFWLETRLLTERFGQAWIYLTQWQVLWAPIIMLVFTFLLVFFVNRFCLNRKVIIYALGGLALWSVALLLEAIRLPFKYESKLGYLWLVLFEEEFELMGAVCIVGAVFQYNREILLNLNEKLRVYFQQRSRIFNKQVIKIILIFYAAVVVGLLGIFAVAKQQVAVGRSEPYLYRKAKRLAVLTQQKKLGEKKEAINIEKVLLPRLVMAGDYLKRNMRANGKFNYSYLPVKDGYRKKYNILRHSGTLFAMLELYEVTKDEELLRKCKLGLEFLESHIKPSRIVKDGKVVVERGKIKLGGNGLAIIAKARYIQITKQYKYLNDAKKLGNWILSSISVKGDFKYHKLYYPSEINTDFRSDYYPGEAILALIYLYEITNDEKWLIEAQRATMYLMEVKYAQGVLADHWLCYALDKLYRIKKNIKYKSFVYKIADHIVARQNIHPENPAWFGSYYRPPRSTPTATRSEALGIAFLLARDFGDSKRAGKYLKALKNGLSFQLRTQFTEQNIKYLPNPKNALGGFKRSLTKNEIRIDYVQHNIASMLFYYRVQNL
jgi:hypothetical protein